MSYLNTDIIDLDKEFLLLVDLIDSLWDGVEKKNAREAIRVAFEQGLEDGKLWIDEYATMRISEVLNGNDEICFPLENRRNLEFEGDSVAYFYDALSIFDTNLSFGLSAIYRSVTGYGRWNYSKNADELCRKLKQMFGEFSVTPKEQDANTQKSIVTSYCGHQANEAGSFPTPERLLKNYVEYSRDEQGMSLFRSLYSTVYSHALYCAKLKNTQIFVTDLLPIYLKRDDPINFDNGEEILALAMKNPFVSIVNAIKPFEFSSASMYCADKRRAEEFKKNKSNSSATFDEQSKIELVDELCLEIENEDKKVDAQIDTIKLSFSGYKLLTDVQSDFEVCGA